MERANVDDDSAGTSKILSVHHLTARGASAVADAIGEWVAARRVSGGESRLAEHLTLLDERSKQRVWHHLSAALLARQELSRGSLERVEWNLAVGAADVARAGDWVQPELLTATTAVQVVRKAELEAVTTAKSGEGALTVTAGALALASKGAAHGADIDASLGHGYHLTLALAGARSSPTKCRMNAVARLLFAALLLPALAVGCSKSEPTSTAPATPDAAPSAPLQAGTPAPDVTFALSSGEKLPLRDLQGKAVVVYFYPKDDTPGCTVEAQEIRDLYEELKGTGATVIGVSTDAADSHRAFAEKHGLPFGLATDEGGLLSKAFGVPMKNGRSSRVSFVVGADGRIKRTFPQVTPKGHAAELLAAVKS